MILTIYNINQKNKKALIVNIKVGNIGKGYKISIDWSLQFDTLLGFKCSWIYKRYSLKLNK